MFRQESIHYYDPAPVGDGRVNGRARILAVDDEIDVANLLVRSLRFAGYQAEPETDGLTALDRLDTEEYDLMLVDLQMPRLRGDELQLRAQSLHPDLAVILVTAAADTELAVECLKAGAYDYILKPFDLHDVSVRVEKALERRATAIELKNYQADLQRKVGDQAGRIRSLLLQSMESLTAALEAKDENTRDHSARVARVALKLAEQLPDYNAEFANKLRIAAMLHDIGKIGIREAVLNKRDLLEPLEFDEIRRHPVLGESILKPLFPDDPLVLSFVRHHHERWDGHGYPDGLARDETPLGARILSIADAYDAMISVRPYRHGLSHSEAMAVLMSGAGSQWDPNLVAIFTELPSIGDDN
ncbi:MAG: HD domain-containing protein [Capsulimonadaceae bacterium]|nr:HD domain-containing protein [Capsulimonadaceae bacterium]